ncbi:hypothetical protein [Pseudorhodoplanes sp.]|uniref:hypothetical protein n=1 Tax=Pseudorhodoplanes sp. TaxID=1934341 RepID=UPI00391D7DC5
MSGDLQRELEALRRELRQVPRVAEEPEGAPGATAQAPAPPPSGDWQSELERLLADVQDKVGEATEDAEDLVAAHPFASVAAAFLLGVLVANVLSRTR